MDALLNALKDLALALLDVGVAVGEVGLPWTPLIAWLGFWLFAVNWVKLREVLSKGGWVGLFLLGAFAVLVWGHISPEGNSSPPSAQHYLLFGLTLSNFVGKTVYVTGLVCLMLLAGSLQLSGFSANLCHFDEPAEGDEHHGGDQGNGHGGHGHDDHGHAVVQVAHH